MANNAHAQIKSIEHKSRETNEWSETLSGNKNFTAIFFHYQIRNQFPSIFRILMLSIGRWTV